MTENERESPDGTVGEVINLSTATCHECLDLLTNDSDSNDYFLLWRFRPFCSDGLSYAINCYVLTHTYPNNSFSLKIYQTLLKYLRLIIKPVLQGRPPRIPGLKVKTVIFNAQKFQTIATIKVFVCLSILDLR